MSTFHRAPEDQARCPQSVPGAADARKYPLLGKGTLFLTWRRGWNATRWWYWIIRTPANRKEKQINGKNSFGGSSAAGASPRAFRRERPGLCVYLCGKRGGNGGNGEAGRRYHRQCSGPMAAGIAKAGVATARFSGRGCLHSTRRSRGAHGFDLCDRRIRKGGSKEHLFAMLLDAAKKAAPVPRPPEPARMDG